jgi:hypothetical protein
MIYGRGTVWVICSEQYDPKFFTSRSDKLKWNTDISKGKFYGRNAIAKSVLTNIKNHPERFGLKTEEIEYTNIIEFELVQHVPDEWRGV